MLAKPLVQIHLAVFPESSASFAGIRIQCQQSSVSCSADDAIAACLPGCRLAVTPMADPPAMSQRVGVLLELRIISPEFLPGFWIKGNYPV
jgi:hypothetical protein